MHVTDNTLATIEFTLCWNCDLACHTERYWARRVNFWRDIFPPRMREALEGCRTGDSILLKYAPGEALPSYNPAYVYSVPHNSFRSRCVPGYHPVPRAGRYFPLMFFACLPGVFGGDMRPARIVRMDSRCMVVDANHPLAGRAFSMEARILDLAEKKGETGGRLTHWLEAVADGGPGIQARISGEPVEVLSDPHAFMRCDQVDDRAFYDVPRSVDHIDAQACAHLRDEIARVVPRGGRVLDLMTGWRTHLPAGHAAHVTGLGLGEAEINDNPVLDERIMHDLNADPQLPLPSASYDAVICTLSVEYLLQPVAVLREAVRVLRPGGIIVLAVSDRWFPGRTIRIWPELHEFERAGLMVDLLQAAGGLESFRTVSVRNWPRPADDRHAGRMALSDPVHVVSAVRTA
jgi:FKBP-type peptidyl-prolyl cis-trans isomerase 2